MEPHVQLGEWSKYSPPLDSIDDYFAFSLTFVEDLYSNAIGTYRANLNAKGQHVTLDWFWCEYIWVVYTAGFNVKVVTKIYPKLIQAYGTWDNALKEDTWSKVFPINANRNKFDAIVKTAGILLEYKVAYKDWWLRFEAEYLISPESMRRLPFVGKITCCHLARNLGFDVVKPDLHLVRLANYFNFSSPLEMCQYLSKEFGEKIGIVDLVLFYAASTYGTLEIRNEGIR